MAYSTQNMYQMFDIIPNFIRKMFPLSLKTYPSCTNTMAWDIRDEIRSAYILTMVRVRDDQRDNQKSAIDDNERDDVPLDISKRGGGGSRFEQLPSNVDTSKVSMESSRSEHLIRITDIDNQQRTPKKLHKCKNNRKSNQPKISYRQSYLSSNEIICKLDSSIYDTSNADTMQSIIDSTSQIDSMKNATTKNSENSSVGKSTARREYQLLAQKFHQYTINCKATIETLEKKLKKLVDDKHALLHGMVSLRKGQKDVIKKYRKIFNDAMNDHCNEINALVANYKVIRDNYLELLQHDKLASDTNLNDDILSVSYTSYNCC